MDEIYKRVHDSETSQVQIVMLEHINGSNRLFGGQLIAWMDVLAAVVARRHSNRNVTTACIDDLQFKAPAHVNDTVFLHGRVTYVGNTSMEVRVDAYTEGLDGERKPVNTAFFTMVALDENEKPVRVPRLLVESDEEKRNWDMAKQRKEIRNRARQERM